MWHLVVAVGSALQMPGSVSVSRSSVSFVNPLEVDGFAEPGGWGFHDDPKSLPLLVFLPGMDGSLSTPFMQYAELSTTFELACMRLVGGLTSRASFDELCADCADAITELAGADRQVLLVGESFGATLAVAVAHELERSDSPPGLRGLVLVNPATSYRRSALATIGPLCASISGWLLSPLYAISLVALAAYVLTPAYQAPSFISTITARKATELNNNPHREAFVGRVAMGAYLGQQSDQLGIGPLLVRCWPCICICACACMCSLCAAGHVYVYVHVHVCEE